MRYSCSDVGTVQGCFEVGAENGEHSLQLFKLPTGENVVARQGATYFSRNEVVDALSNGHSGVKDLNFWTCHFFNQRS